MVDFARRIIRPDIGDKCVLHQRPDTCVHGRRPTSRTPASRRRPPPWAELPRSLLSPNLSVAARPHRASRATIAYLESNRPKAPRAGDAYGDGG